EDAKKLAESLGVGLNVIELDVLGDETVTSNPSDRCYHCKRVIFGNILERAKEDGFTVIMDGSNASDSADDRPGMKALAEMSVRSPLREAGLSKDEIRRLSREAGLFTWDKPAYACLATRIPTSKKIDAESLTKVENAENILFKMGFSDLRCRLLGDSVKIQLPKTQLEKAAACHAEITDLLSPYFNDILLDLKPR
ncbi:MAG: ATP-dependent sacrificial sulfur transferase LarE, partial [Ruminococcus sp.]|nr:ATP-dependent sacrificial sulfur transferase LarE [Ruminococcus sp.]